MVTLYQLRSYADWCVDLLESLGDGTTELSGVIASWCEDSNVAMVRALERLAASDTIDDERRWTLLEALGRAAERARNHTRERGLGDVRTVDRSAVADFFRLTRHLCDHSIGNAKRDDGLYESYRVLHLGESRAGVETLAPMLEGQVAVLAAGVLDEKESLRLLGELFGSELYREDQRTFILYPRVDLPALTDRNRVSDDAVSASPVLAAALERPEAMLVYRDCDGTARFHADLGSHEALRDRLDTLASQEPWDALIQEDRGKAWQAYEQTFHHARFTGRSGTMHKYEGLGSVYWHMVSKLLLAVQETVFRAADRDAAQDDIDALIGYYRRIRDGLGFRKSPWEFGAIPHEPYSHTPWGMGAQQPGMTGQVKEGVIARYGELGLRLDHGRFRIDPTLIDPDECLTRSHSGTTIGLEVPAGGVGCTICGIPYTLAFGDVDQIEIRSVGGSTDRIDGRDLPEEASNAIFRRDGSIEAIRVTVRRPQDATG